MAQGGRGSLALPAAPHYIIISRPGPASHLGLNPAARICNHCITLPDLCPSPPLPAPAADCLQIPTKNGRHLKLASVLPNPPTYIRIHAPPNRYAVPFSPGHPLPCGGFLEPQGRLLNRKRPSASSCFLAPSLSRIRKRLPAGLLLPPHLVLVLTAAQCLLERLCSALADMIFS